MELEKILSKYPNKKEFLLEILHDIQNSNTKNYIPQEAIDAVSHHLNIKKAQVYGVIGYYSMFSSKPRGKYIIRVCASPICNMMGSCNLLDYLKQKLGVELDDTTADGLFTLETTECLGNCAAAPAMMVNQEMYGNLTPGMIDSILESYSEQTK